MVDMVDGVVDISGWGVGVLSHQPCTPWAKELQIQKRLGKLSTMV
jgi:hypothetical protein